MWLGEKKKGGKKKKKHWCWKVRMSTGGKGRKRKVGSGADENSVTALLQQATQLRSRVLALQLEDDLEEADAVDGEIKFRIGEFGKQGDGFEVVAFHFHD